MRCILIGILTLLTVALHAQATDSTSYPPINEDLFVNTQWKYTYTTHAQSNTIIHKAEDDYAHFLFFKYDYSYQMHLNGKLTYGEWELNEAENQLYYPFRNMEWWHIAQFTEDALILEFSLNSKSAYRYHFVRVSPAESPFERSPFDLPDINVDQSVDGSVSIRSKYQFLKKNKGRSRQPNKRQEARRKRRLARYLRRKQRRQERLAKRGKIPVEDLEHLKIELVGGGFYGGVNPVYRNTLTIQTDGRIIWEYHTQLNGLVVTKSQISRETLEKLIDFCEEKNFFEFDRIYTCETLDCNKRMRQSPRPIALRLAITKGSKRHLVTVNIWNGLEQANRFIDYPKELDAIVDAIKRTAIDEQQ